MEFVSSSEKNITISLAENGKTAELRAVLLASPEELHQTDWAGDGLLAIACWHCREDTAAMLISEFKMDVNARNNQGSTPLHRASAGGDLNCAHLLLEKGAESFCCDKNGKKPIDVAASHEMRELIQGLLDSTEEYIRELQKKIDEADKEHDHMVALQLEADRKIRVAARVQDAVPLLIQGAKNSESNGFFDPLGDSYDDWPVYRRRIDVDNTVGSMVNQEKSSSSSSSSSTRSTKENTAVDVLSTTNGITDIYLFFSGDESSWIIQHVHPEKIEQGSHMFAAFQALHLGHLPFERQGKRYLKCSCSSNCFPELRPEGSNGIEEYIYVRRSGVLASTTEISCVSTTTVEILTEAEYKMNQEVAVLKAERARQEHGM